MTDAEPDGRQDTLKPVFDECYEPQKLVAQYPELVNQRALSRSWFSRLVGLLRLINVPVCGMKYHRDISLVSRQIDAFVLPVLMHLLKTQSPDFVFVTPQLNPSLLRLKTTIPSETRTILLTYDVEAVRISRLADVEKGLARYAKRLESGRAERFEQDNIRLYDGIVVVSDLDKTTMISKYGLDEERVLTIENSVDVDYFSFEPQIMDPDSHNIVFVGNLAYWPNHDAAIRLLRSIMPRIQSSFPLARAVIIGDKPSRKLMTYSDPGVGIIVGSVDDVRSVLHQASVVCVPLRAGSGTKYKVLEALSSGRPVVCSSVATEGLQIQSETHCLVVDSDEEIADACIQILKKPAAYQDMVHRARKQIEQHYSWDRNLNKMDIWLERIKQMQSVRYQQRSISN